MKRKLVFALVSAATLAVVPAFAEGEEATTTTTTTATATTTAPAAASGEKEFGNAGVINFAAATRLDLAFSSIKPPGGGDSSSRTKFAIQPSIDYFVIDNLSIGASILFDTTSEKAAGASDSDSSTTIGLGPRVGYNVWLSPPTLSLWPQVGILYNTTSTKSKGQDGNSFNTIALQVFIPLVIHPVKHFHMAVGPYMSMDLASKAKPPTGDSVDASKTTTFGLMGEIAGWL